MVIALYNYLITLPGESLPAFETIEYTEPTTGTVGENYIVTYTYKTKDVFTHQPSVITESVTELDGIKTVVITIPRIASGASIDHSIIISGTQVITDTYAFTPSSSGDSQTLVSKGIPL